MLITEALCIGRPWHQVAKAALAPRNGQRGADCIQLREKHLNDRELLSRAKQLVELCHEHQSAAVINDRVDIALESGADAVHLGQDDTSIEAARSETGHRLWIGSSTTNLNQAQKAIDQGVDYCGVGPMFSTATKPNRTPATTEYLGTFRRTHPNTPHLAIGGINDLNIQTVLAAGAKGIAISSAICSAANPSEQLIQFKQIIDNYLCLKPTNEMPESS